MNLEENTSFVLRYGSLIGIIIAAAGLAASLLGIGHSDGIMTAGITMIVFTPFAGMLVSFVTLSMNREKRYALSAAALIAITVIGMLIAFILE
ncbi:MAG: hypothetical protein FWG58_00340 [Methanomassiliicoccaceae archaeon]|nr:hypothetical protein [Methanomassiliicoccaceae archaeon]